MSGIALVACESTSDDAVEIDGGTPPVVDSGGLPNIEEVSGTISSDTTWHADTVYVVVDDLDVAAALTIEPGTVIQVEASNEISVEGDGSLNADGTEDAPILFTGAEEQPGWWAGIVFFNSEHPNNRLNHVIVEYAGHDKPAAVVIGDSNSTHVGAAEIRNTTVRYNDARGLRLYHPSTLRDSQDNDYHDNNHSAVRVDKRNAHHLDGSSSYADNDNPYVEIDASGIGADIGGDVTWEALDAPYRITGSNTVEVEAVLTIEPGTVIEFDGGSGMRFSTDDSGLVANGTEDAQIIFTGSEEQPGWWHGVQLRQSDYPANAMSHVVVEYGGGDSEFSANITVGGDIGSIRNASLTLSDSVIAHSEGHGVLVTHPDSELVDGGGNEFIDNAGEDIQAPE